MIRCGCTISAWAFRSKERMVAMADSETTRTAQTARHMADESPTMTVGPTMGAAPAMGGSTPAGPSMGSPAIAPARSNGALGITNIGEAIARPPTTRVAASSRRYERYRVSVHEYVTFRE